MTAEGRAREVAQRIHDWLMQRGWLADWNQRRALGLFYDEIAAALHEAEQSPSPEARDAGARDAALDEAIRRVMNAYAAWARSFGLKLSSKVNVSALEALQANLIHALRPLVAPAPEAEGRGDREGSRAGQGETERETLAKSLERYHEFVKDAENTPEYWQGAYEVVGDELTAARCEVNALRGALTKAHACATLRPDGTCDGCFVSDALSVAPASDERSEEATAGNAAP
jgi:hypothetical protein